jgi:peptide/nickel transport system substrate-binding protein
MLFIKDTLLEHGIIMQQDPQEWSIFIERVDGRAFDACALAWGGGAIEGDIRQMFHSSQIANGANNFTNYRNPELDRLIDEARRTIDEPQRMKLWQACHRILYEDQPYTFLLRRKSLRFIDKRFKNTQMVRVGMNDRTEWYVPTLQQKRQ